MNKREGFLLIVSGPAGAGKGSICNGLMELDKDVFFSISSTTRDKRPGEEDGVHYNFIDEKKFREEIKKGSFLEYAEVHGNLYGSPKDFVVSKIDQGKIVLLEIDVQGARDVMSSYDNYVSVFIGPPSMKILRERITNRGTESKDIIDLRMENAKKELESIAGYDYLIINDKLEESIEDLLSIVKGERLKTSRFDLVNYLESEVE